MSDGSGANLVMWFTNYCSFLVEKEFAQEGGKNSKNDLVFGDDVLCRIVNIDEMAISLDGIKTRASDRWATQHFFL